MIHRLVETWRAAQEDPGNGQLAYREVWGTYPARQVTSEWWLGPADYGVGASLSWERRSPLWDGNVTLAVQVGPLTWCLVLHTWRAGA